MGIFAMQHLTVQQKKKEGAHYTPRKLAEFVAHQICNEVDFSSKTDGLRILEPAVGDGELLSALFKEIHSRKSTPTESVSFDTDKVALKHAANRIASLGISETVASWRDENFLDFALTARGEGGMGPLFQSHDCEASFDLVIANPPYVRTQVLGQEQSQAISRKFGLKGRVDLYQAFLLGISEVLKPGGIAGVIVSNRFLSTQGGASLRSELLERYELLHIWDLGDTKLFEAAVLPAVLLLRKKGRVVRKKQHTKFTSVYSCKPSEKAPLPAENIFEVLGENGTFLLPDTREFLVTQGTLDVGRKANDVWRLSNPKIDAWLRCVDEHTGLRFRDIGKVRVGVKTTADKVFIRSDWRTFRESEQPELLKPLITHHVARRFKATSIQPQKEILYTHYSEHGRKRPVDLLLSPRAAGYLQGHRKTLEARKYVIEAGREWFEIWVPQNPSAWKYPKLVFRDISKEPTFWMDLSGAVVNGDCYWITASAAKNERLLWVALGVANSRFIEAYYDAKYNNKLYAGRRRFMTQYVEDFPLPHLTDKHTKQIEECSRAIYEKVDRTDCSGLQAELDELVAAAFGVGVEEVGG